EMKRNQEEFLKMLSAYQGIIHKVNQIYFKSKADKEENFQETAYQLWRSFHSLQNREKPASWIYTVAINTSISKIRKDSLLDFRDSVPDVDMIDPYEHIEQNENYQRLIDALYELNEIDRSIMLLYMEEYNYHEIAEIVGMNSSNIGVKVHRLKNQLQKHFNSNINGNK
ncbi:MAG: RNA polymerase sigma factor, partial [Lachnospiraceae bacterium]|nr:RNA polymerase sigma factor [Lachnospiraceae bacterium]